MSETEAAKLLVEHAIYQFMKKKRSEGKPYHVALVNNFMRINYTSVNVYLDAFDLD